MTEHAHSQAAFRIAFAGDLVLDVPEPDYWLGGITPLLRSADLAIGHLEVPHTRRGEELRGDVPAPGADPDAVTAIRRSGFHAVTLAGNHIADRGAEGIEDTRAALADAGIEASGAGANLEEARRPAWLRLGSHRVALFSYNCVGPEAAWATENRAGCAYLPLAAADGAPVTPLSELAMTDYSRDILVDDIDAVRDRASLVIVAMHKGIVHTPATLAGYERELAQAAVDAGADIVVGHHAHIVRGIEIYRGKPIFHGLGNGCVVTRALAPDQAHPDRAAWAQRRKKLFGFEPDPAYTLAPFHPEAVNAMLGHVTWRPGHPPQAGIIPLHVEAPGRPVAATGIRAGEVVDYIIAITERAGLPPVRLQPGPDAWSLH